MRDVDLYQAVLGITAPWKVTRVELGLEAGRVDVYVEHGPKELFPCPECGTPSPVHDHAPGRTWRHLDTCQYRTLLHAVPPRVRCETHGVKQASLPWSEPKSQFTLLFERFAIDVLRSTDVASAARILRISWDEAWTIKKRAVKRGQARRAASPKKTTRYGVDEKSPGRGQSFFTVVCDLESKTVEWIGDGRRAETLDTYWKSLSQADRDAIEAVAMDMSGPYFASTVRHVPDAVKKIVFDRFHVMKYATGAVDQVRRNEQAAISRTTPGPSPLAKTRHLWLYSAENLPERFAARFEELKKHELLTGKAYGMKELLRRLRAFTDKRVAGAFLTRFIRSAKAMALTPMRKLADMLSDKRVNILTYVDLRVTSATAEGLNSAIQQIKTAGRGFRNRENFKTAIYFALGGLELHPTLPGLRSAT